MARGCRPAGNLLSIDGFHPLRKTLGREFRRRASGVSGHASRETGLWERGEELHQERAYSVPELTAMLEQAGFRSIKTYGERRMRPPREGEQRIFFAAEKEG